MLSIVPDTAGNIFEPNALSLPATQTLRSTDTIVALDGDLTIECWFKWNTAVTSATLEIGLQSGAKILVARDVNDPLNDRFGISATHGSFVAAPGFNNWQDVGDEEAGLNEWRHLGLAIHSAGVHHDAVAGHDVYSTGTVGRLYLNGHIVGFSPHTINLAGLKVHDASRITITMRGGGMTVDEVAVWRRDWSENGANTNPVADGRSAASIQRWLKYDEQE